MTTDRIEEITIQLHYPASMVLTTDQLAAIPAVSYRCTVEVVPCHTKNRPANEVKAVRVIGMQDSKTRRWTNHHQFNKNERRAFKEATFQAVLDVLQVVPRRNNVSWSVPEEAFVNKP